VEDDDYRIHYTHHLTRFREAVFLSGGNDEQIAANATSKFFSLISEAFAATKSPTPQRGSCQKSLGFVVVGRGERI
jgi:hypothetical protein